MANEPNLQPWWTRKKKQTLADRVNAVQNVNDPTIMSDDVLKWSKVALYALLTFTTLLSGFSYFKFFEHSFGHDLAIMMAMLLACIIEFGKNWGGLRVLRIPFFQGWRHIWHTVANTIMWAGLLALAVVTFTASVYNSTKGAEQLSLLLGHEKNRTVFTPNTADIDAQISATEKRIADNRGTKWKGTTTVDAQRAIKAESRNLTSLQAQRETRIQQQRADFEKESGIKDSQNRFTAGSLMAVGGWVELLQVILMFVRVAAERSLDKTGTERRATPPPFQVSQPQQQNGKTAYHNEANRIGFYWQGYGKPTDALTQQPLFQSESDQNTVPQSPQTVPQPNGENYADSVLEVCRQAIQRDMANFNNRQAKAATVASRIHTALNTCYGAMQKPGFNPTYETGLKLYSYLQESVFPRLDQIGHPFEGETMFVERLYHAFKKAEPTTR